MKKVLVVIVVLMVLCGCGKGVENEDVNSERFNTEKHGYNIMVIEDTETGVKYLYYYGSNRNGGLTKLEEKKGNDSNE